MCGSLPWNTSYDALVNDWLRGITFSITGNVAMINEHLGLRVPVEKIQTLFFQCPQRGQPLKTSTHIEACRVRADPRKNMTHGSLNSTIV